MVERLCDICPLDPSVVIVGEAIDPNDLMAVAEQAISQVATDEAGHAGDQCSHSTRFRSRTAARKPTRFDCDIRSVGARVQTADLVGWTLLIVTYAVVCFGAHHPAAVEPTSQHGYRTAFGAIASRANRPVQGADHLHSSSNWLFESQDPEMLRA